jgi:hypothetical protein
MNSIVNREQTKIDEADKKFIVFRPVRLLLPVVEPQFKRKSTLWDTQYLYRHGANRARIVPGEHTPNIHNVVAPDTSTEYGAWPGRQIECKPIGALAIVRIEIVEGSAVEDRLVRWPFPYRNARCMAVEMESRIAFMKRYYDKSVGQVEATGLFVGPVDGIFSCAHYQAPKNTDARPRTRGARQVWARRFRRDRK